MEGEVKITLEDFLSLKQHADESSQALDVINTQATLFKNEVSLLLNFIYAERDIIAIIKEFNKQSKVGFIKVDTDEKTMELQLKLS